MYLTCGSLTLPPDVVDRIAAFLEVTQEEYFYVSSFGAASFCVRPMNDVDKPVAVLRAFFDRVVVHFRDNRHAVPPADLTTSEERHDWYRSRPAAPSKAVKWAMEDRIARLQLLQSAVAVELRMCSNVWECPARSEVHNAVMKWTKKRVSKEAPTKLFVDVDCTSTEVERRAAFGRFYALHCLFYELATSPLWTCEMIAPMLPSEVNDDQGPHLHSILITRPHPFFQSASATEDAHIPPLLEAGVDFYEIALQKDRELGVGVKEPKKKAEPKRKPAPKKKPAAKRRKQ